LIPGTNVSFEDARESLFSKEVTINIYKFCGIKDVWYSQTNSEGQPSANVVIVVNIKIKSMDLISGFYHRQQLFR